MTRVVIKIEEGMIDDVVADEPVELKVIEVDRENLLDDVVSIREHCVCVTPGAVERLLAEAHELAAKEFRRHAEHLSQQAEKIRKEIADAAD